LRIERTLKVLQRTEFAIYLNDITDFDKKEQDNMLKQFKKFNIPYMIVFNKIDKLETEALNSFNELYKDALFVITTDEKNVIDLKNALIDKINDSENEPTIIGDLVPYGGTVLMVVPIDSEAPKGRIILPQVQLIRDCLDNGIKSYVVRDTELKEALTDLKRIDLVVTDSQAFKSVSAMVPGHIPLTSFSILFARYKGDIKSFVSGVNTIKDLKDGAKILISESCTHNHSHEDIGRYKIPKLLNQKENKTFDYDFKMGHDFPVNLSDYDLVIHCGSCMLNKKTMQTRIMICESAGVPITNYGVVLAYATSILDRTLKVKNL
ncbi:MAG: [FeFe] hydrogenase H-cluster maturation GTPase HydF, partial [Acidaminobacteraceae bacterium]